MTTETRSVFPCQLDTPVETLIDLARWAFTHLAQDLDTSALVDSSHAEEHESFKEVRRSYGRPNRCFALVDRTEYFEMGGWLGSRRWTSVQSQGLPEGTSLRIAVYDEGWSATVEVAAPGALAAKVAGELAVRLTPPPNEKLLDALAQQLDAHLSRREQYRAALSIDPNNHPVAFQLGRALEESGRRDEALAAYRLADSTSPNPTGAWGYRGLDLTKQARAAIQRLDGPSG